MMTNEAACVFGTEMKEKQCCLEETCHNFTQPNNASKIDLARKITCCN